MPHAKHHTRIDACYNCVGGAGRACIAGADTIMMHYLTPIENMTILPAVSIEIQDVLRIQIY